MAISDQSSSKTRENMMKIVNKGDKKIYLVAHELKLARVLAGNNKTARDRALGTLKKWFTERSKTIPFTEDDFQRIWKGLFYSMWMSDKPLIQEECSENIANLIHFLTLNDSLLFFKAGVTILNNEWFGIDQLRLDKFLMLVRRLLRQMFVVLKENGLNKKNLENFSNVLSETILDPNAEPPMGLLMHFIEIFLEELAKVTKGNINPDRFIDILQPFIKKLVVTDDGRLIGHIRKFIFTYLIRQSDLGLEYQEKYHAWKKLGFPGSIDSVQKIKLDNNKNVPSEDQKDKSDPKKIPLDPRAGRVNVELPQIKFNPKAVAAALLCHKFDKNSNAKSRKMISVLADQFNKLGNGLYPLGVKRVIDNEKDAYDTNIRKATNRLVKFEKKLMGNDRDRKRKRNNESDETKFEVKEKRRKVEQRIDEVKRVDNSKTINDEKMGGDEARHKEIRNKINKGTFKNKDVDSKKVNSLKIEDNNEAGLKITTKHKIKESTPENKKAGNNKQINNKKIDISDKQLTQFIKNSEKKINKKIKDRIAHNRIEKKKNKKKTKSNERIINNIECVFERNSGTWIVYDISSEKERDMPSLQTESPNKSLGILSEIKETPSKSSENFESFESTNKTKTSELPNVTLGGLNKSQRSSKSKRFSLKDTKIEQNSSLNSGLNPVKLFESPPKQNELFPKFEWDEPLQEGEYEICIPSKKYMGKMKTLAKKNRHSIHELINTSVKIKGKSRLSLDANIVKNPFSTPNTKKVKINTKLNSSQEVHEHHARIKNSPGIPYDANKKPSKPLLKSPACSSPINPFYNKQLSI